MKHLKTFQEDNYRKEMKHNEIFGLFKKQSSKSEQLTKDSMWIYNPPLYLIEPTQNLYKYHVEIEDRLNIDNIKNHIFNKGSNDDTVLWLKDTPYNRSGRMVRVSDILRYIRQGGKIYDFTKYFKKLKEISNKLGYKIGTSVYVKEFDKVGKIELLRESCICSISNSGNIGNVVLTLYYKVNVPGESHPYGFYYNISQIEIVEKQETLKIDIDDISDFFIDLIDNEDIKLDISLMNDQKGEYIVCTISYLKRVESVFNQLISSYLRFSDVMKSQYGLNTIVVDINMSKISFKLKQ